MGDFVYDGGHSITIDPDGININTWKDWHMAPKSRPFVTAPPVKEEYVNVPGADGALDYTEALTGKARYGRRTGAWDFIVDNFYKDSWPEFYSTILMKIHGKNFDKIILDDDPDYYYKGRLTVNGSFGNKDYNGVQIAYNLDPYKNPIGLTDRKDWAWNDLFGLTIFFGSFTVSGLKLHDIFLDSDVDAEGNFEATNHMAIYNLENFNDGYSIPSKGVSSAKSLISSGMTKYEARAYCLLNSNFDRGFTPPIYIGAGDNSVTLKPGHNVYYFKGNGLIKVSYERGRTL